MTTTGGRIIPIRQRWKTSVYKPSLEFHVATTYMRGTCTSPNLQVTRAVPNKETGLVGGWTNPLEKYAREIGSFPQGSGVKLQEIFWVARTQRIVFQPWRKSEWKNIDVFFWFPAGTTLDKFQIQILCIYPYRHPKIPLYLVVWRCDFGTCRVWFDRSVILPSLPPSHMDFHVDSWTLDSPKPLSQNKKTDVQQTDVPTKARSDMIDRHVPGDSIRDLFGDGEKVTLLRGCWWPPIRGWKGHFESPDMEDFIGFVIIKSGQSTIIPIIPKPEFGWGRYNLPR